MVLTAYRPVDALTSQPRANLESAGKSSALAPLHCNQSWQLQRIDNASLQVTGRVPEFAEFTQPLPSWSWPMLRTLRLHLAGRCNRAMPAIKYGPADVRDLAGTLRRIASSAPRQDTANSTTNSNAKQSPAAFNQKQLASVKACIHTAPPMGAEEPMGTAAAEEEEEEESVNGTPVALSIPSSNNATVGALRLALAGAVVRECQLSHALSHAPQVLAMLPQLEVVVDMDSPHSGMEAAGTAPKQQGCLVLDGSLASHLTHCQLSPGMDLEHYYALISNQHDVGDNCCNDGATSPSEEAGVAAPACEHADRIAAFNSATTGKESQRVSGDSTDFGLQPHKFSSSPATTHAALSVSPATTTAPSSPVYGAGAAHTFSITAFPVRGLPCYPNLQSLQLFDCCPALTASWPLLLTPAVLPNLKSLVVHTGSEPVHMPAPIQLPQLQHCEVTGAGFVYDSDN